MELINYAYREHKYVLICDAFAKTPNLLTCLTTPDDYIMVLNMFRKRYFYNEVYKIIAQKLLDLDVNANKPNYTFPMLWYYLYLYKFNEFNELYSKAMSMTTMTTMTPETESSSEILSIKSTLRMLDMLYKIAIFEYDYVYPECFQIIKDFVSMNVSYDGLNLYHLTLPLTEAQHCEICYIDCRKQLAKYPSSIYAFDKYYHYERLKVKKTKLRIGFYSNDFYNRPTAQLTVNVFRHLCELVDVYIYCHPSYTKDDYFEKYRRYCTKFVEIPIHFGPKEIADTIYADMIDVLVDLKGRMITNQLEIFKYKPAPVQVSWIAYPGTTGMIEMDYFIGDQIVFIPGVEEFYPEKLIYLPICYQPNNDSQTLKIQEFPAGDLKIMEDPDKIILANVNFIYKLDKETILSYKKILELCPNAVIFLLINANCPNIIKYFDKEKERIFFFHYLPKNNHLYRLHKYVDIGLDSFYCNSHTTASDLLFAGVPIVSLQGNTFQGRVCSSLLHYANCKEFIVQTPNDYVIKVVELIYKGKSALKEIKESIRYRLFKSNIFNSYIYAEYFKSSMEIAVDNYINDCKENIIVPQKEDYNKLSIKHKDFVIIMKTSDLFIYKFYIHTNEFICVKQENLIYFNGKKYENNIMSDNSFKLLIKDFTMNSSNGKLFDLIPWDTDSELIIKVCKPIIFGAENAGNYTCQIGIMDEKMLQEISDKTNKTDKSDKKDNSDKSDKSKQSKKKSKNKKKK
jgi:hypothetical protein